MPEKSLVEKLREVFLKRHVLDIKDVYKTIRTNSRTTAYRYLQKLDALSSYSHAGKYYTLKEIAQFDEDGLWHNGEIGFSRYGTLMNTIVHLISVCDNGKSCSELEKQQRVYVQNALLTLVKTKKLSRQVVNGVYVYVSADPDQSLRQIQNRFEQEEIAPLPDWIVMQVLVATIKCISEHVKEEEVALLLKKQGSSVTLDQVQRVFKLYSLEKKTPDFTP
jgi:Uri superfamily endonuclease